VAFLPLCYGDILTHLRAQKITAAVFMVSPPDAAGICSFGPVVDFLAELWPHIPVRIAHINSKMPRTFGHQGIPYKALNGVIEKDVPLLGMEDERSDEVASAIGRHVAAIIPDRATLQTGLGKVPGAVLRGLTGHQGLRIHSGLIGDAVLDLAASGALAEGVAVCAGVAIGSPRLYSAVSAPIFEFRPVSFTHSANVLGRIERLYTVNSAISVDLFGQAYAELTPWGLMSGPGGAVDFARGAKIAGGVRIVALPAAANGGKLSRIVLPGMGAGPVSLGRMDIDIVITEHGAADLRGLGYTQRASRLINIASPPHRDALTAGWQQFSQSL
jgi:acyl-CoA hydrolase